jgi:hypothetical protein
LAEDAGKSRTNNSTSDRFFSHSTGKLVVRCLNRIMFKVLKGFI